MPVIYSNNASTSLSAGINNSTTTIPIASNSGFPSISSGEYFFATIANTANTKIEVVKVTSGTTSLTVTRGQGGTNAQAFDSGDNFQLRVTADTLLAATQTDVKVTSGTVSADTLIAKGDGSSADGQIQLNCSQNSHGIKLKSPPHSAGASYTLTFPNDDGTNGQKLTTNGSGVLTWTTVDLTALSAAALTSGIVPTARINAGSIANDLINSQHIAADSIDAEHLAPNSVNSDAYIDDSILAAHLAANSVNTDAIIDDAVTSAHLAAGSVDATALGNDVVNSQHIAADSIDAEHYAAGSVDATAIGNDAVNSQHYQAASIDNEHLADNAVGTAEIANDAVTAAKIADNAIDSDMYVDGSIDLAHMSSESVDEDNLHISNAGTNGYFLSKQSGNAGGLTWAEVVSEDFIPNGSVMAFFQSAAPTGWTKVTSQNNKVLRVVSGNGGGTGGTWATSSGVTTNEVGAHVHSSAAHTHTAAAHVHSGAAHSHNHNLSAGAHTISTNEMPSHNHQVGGRRGAFNGYMGISGNQYWNGSYTGNPPLSSTGGGASHAHSLAGAVVSGGDGNTGSTTPSASGSTTPGNSGSANAHSHTVSAPQYIDVIICSKDS